MRKYCFFNPGLKFFNAKVIHKAALALNNTRVGWLSVLKIMLICLTSSKARLEYCLALTLTAFYIDSSKLFNSWSHSFILAQSEGFGPSLKYLIMVGSLGAPSTSNSNKINCRYLRWEALPNIDSQWYYKLCLTLLQKVSPKALEYLRFFRKILLNLSYVIGTTLLKYRLYYCYCYTTVLYKNNATNRIQLGHWL